MLELIAESNEFIKRVQLEFYCRNTNGPRERNNNLSRTTPATNKTTSSTSHETSAPTDLVAQAENQDYQHLKKLCWGASQRPIEKRKRRNSRRKQQRFQRRLRKEIKCQAEEEAEAAFEKATQKK
jgi:hypothetical protein